MPLPSSPDYIPAAKDERVLNCAYYRQLLSMDTDPYASHSYNPLLIETVEEFATEEEAP
jgi:hypothetical protein